jgi:heme/copper-type cytochrome/quinol oxidase subunit 3
MSARAVIDVSKLPTYAYSHRSLMWWGTLGLIAIESTVFVLAVFSYFYVRTRIPHEWPPTAIPPALTWGTANLIATLLSIVPNYWTKKVAEAEDLAKVRIGLIVSALFGVASLVVRVFEFTALNVRWDLNAYGSAVWTLIGLHTVHLATDVFDTIVLMVLMFVGPLEGKRFVDVSENAMYWYFVVFAWIPIYLVIYWGARVL